MDESMTGLESLGERVAEVLGSHSTERRLAIERARRGYLEEIFAVERPKRHWPMFALGVALVACLSLGMAWLQRPLAFTAGDERGAAHTWIAAPDDRAVPLIFSDGSRLRLEPSSRARVVSVGAHGASLALEDGRIRGEIADSAHHTWRVIAGPLTARVTGTHFDLRWSAADEVFSISVNEGSVTVEGPALLPASPVLPGKTLHVFVNQQRAELARSQVP